MAHLIESSTEQNEVVLPRNKNLESDGSADVVRIESNIGSSALGKQKSKFKLEYFLGLFGISLILIWSVVRNPDLNDSRIINLIIIIAALCLLVGASDIVLEFSVKLAELLHVSELVIGLTIVAIGTSIPEIFTAILSAQKGVGAFIIGDIFGSDITQLTIFMGIVILASPLTVNRKIVPHVKRDGGLMLCSILFLSFNISDGLFTLTEAIISISLFTVYVLYLYISASHKTETKKEQIKYIVSMEEMQGVHSEQEKACAEIKEKETEEISVEVFGCPPLPVHKGLKIAKYVVLVIFGTLLCYVGASFVVDSGSNIATSFGVSEHVIGATIVGFGTGFPEFIVSIQAVRKKKFDIAFGNLLGSNIVDPLLSISLGVLFKPIALGPEALTGILGFLLPFAIIVDVFVILIFNRKSNTKTQGIIIGSIFILLYCCFLAGSLL
jgi:cation:H+ antiporter